MTRESHSSLYNNLMLNEDPTHEEFVSAFLSENFSREKRKFMAEKSSGYLYVKNHNIDTLALDLLKQAQASGHYTVNIVEARIEAQMSHEKKLQQTKNRYDELCDLIDDQEAFYNALTVDDYNVIGL